MRVAHLIVLALVAASTPVRALADGFCVAPLADWQPRDALEAKLEGDGWRGIAIRIEDGCYLVHAFNDQGDRLHGKCDPATLAPLLDRGHGHGRHGHDGWGEDRSGD